MQQIAPPFKLQIFTTTGDVLTPREWNYAEITLNLANVVIPVQAISRIVINGRGHSYLTPGCKSRMDSVNFILKFPIARLKKCKVGAHKHIRRKYLKHVSKGDLYQTVDKSRRFTLGQACKDFFSSKKKVLKNKTEEVESDDSCSYYSSDPIEDLNEEEVKFIRSVAKGRIPCTPEGDPTLPDLYQSYLNEPELYKCYLETEDVSKVETATCVADFIEEEKQKKKILKEKIYSIKLYYIKSHPKEFQSKLLLSYMYPRYFKKYLEWFSLNNDIEFDESIVASSSNLLRQYYDGMEVFHLLENTKEINDLCLLVNVPIEEFLRTEGLRSKFNQDQMDMLLLCENPVTSGKRYALSESRKEHSLYVKEAMEKQRKNLLYGTIAR